MTFSKEKLLKDTATVKTVATANVLPVTVKEQRSSVRKIPSKQIHNAVPLSSTTEVIREATAEVDAIVCKTTIKDKVYFDIPADEC